MWLSIGDDDSPMLDAVIRAANTPGGSYLVNYSWPGTGDKTQVVGAGDITALIDLLRQTHEHRGWMEVIALYPDSNGEWQNFWIGDLASNGYAEQWMIDITGLTSLRAI